MVRLIVPPSLTEYKVPQPDTIYNEPVIEEPKEPEGIRDQGAILIDFGGRIREHAYSGNETYYVVASDGSMRKPDKDTENQKMWKAVHSNELALYHTKSFQHDPHVFKVRHQPEDELTETQKCNG